MLGIKGQLRSFGELDNAITLPLKLQDRIGLQIAIYIKSIVMR